MSVEIEDSEEVSLKDRVLELLDKGVVKLVIDTRVPGVVVPERFYGCPNLKLNFSPRFDHAPDLELTDDGIKQTLSFSGERHPVFIPWNAVYAYYSEQGGQFGFLIERFPAEAMASIMEAIQGEMPWEPMKPKTMRNGLRVVS